MKRVLVITSCTGDKAVAHEKALTLADFQQGTAHIKKREKELAKLKTRADELYTGQHHVRLMRGVNSVGSNGKPAEFEVDLRILSAGYGFVTPERKLAPYECTFQTMRAKEIDAWANSLGTPKQFRDLVAEKYDLILILLSDDYLRACSLTDDVVFGGHILLLCGTSLAKKLPKLKKLKPVIASTPETKRFNCGQLALKGEIGGRILKGLYEQKFTIADTKSETFDLLASLDSVITNEDAKVTKTHAAHKTPPPRFTVHTPRRSAAIHYFIPEWDDRVDPRWQTSAESHRHTLVDSTSF
jgi:hypothetical protein